MEKRNYELIHTRTLNEEIEKNITKTTPYMDVVLSKIYDTLEGIHDGCYVSVFHNGCEMTEYDVEDMSFNEMLSNVIGSFIDYLTEYISEGNYDFDFQLQVVYKNCKETLIIK